MLMFNSQNLGIHNSHLLHPWHWTHCGTQQAQLPLHYSTVNLHYILVSKHANQINPSSHWRPHWHCLKCFKVWWEMRSDHYNWLQGNDVFCHYGSSDSRPDHYLPFTSSWIICVGSFIDIAHPTMKHISYSFHMDRQQRRRGHLMLPPEHVLASLMTLYRMQSHALMQTLTA